VVVIGLGQVNFFAAWAGSRQPSLFWVRVWKIPPKNPKIFNFFSFGSKKSLRVGSKLDGFASYLLRVKSMLGSGQGPSLLSNDEKANFKHKLLFIQCFETFSLLFWTIKIFLSQRAFWMNKLDEVERKIIFLDNSKSRNWNGKVARMGCELS